MKFGETLRQRSIPQWAHYNVDYDELKHLIKERTTDTKAKPVSIPGQGSQSFQWAGLEEELFSYLWDQHERVNLFAKSKYGEIDRRLCHLQRQLAQLGKRCANSRNKSPLHQNRRFQNLVMDADAIGEDIQSLSRYTNTQKIAFKKILKKYQKWTGSSKLTIRMNNEILNRPTSFLQPDFEPLLSTLTEIQTTLRGISDKGPVEAAQLLRAGSKVSLQTDSAHNEISTSACAITASFQNENPLEVDRALFTTPLSSFGGRVSYWVHNDNVAELRVLLLRHMREFGSKGTPPLSRTSSVNSIGSRKGSLHSASEYVDEVLFDNLEAFVKEQNAAPLNRNEDNPGSCALTVLMQACSINGSKNVAVSTSIPSQAHLDNGTLTSRIGQFRTRTAKKKEVDSLLLSSEVPSIADEQSVTNLQELKSWLAQNPKVRPLAHVKSRRSRFQGLDNSENSGAWAVLVEDISMARPSRNTSVFEYDQETEEKFPYCILSLRWEQYPVPEIISLLMNSYLVERVPGFSLHTHAVYAMCTQKNATRPLWMSNIDKDIRKIPSKTNKSTAKLSPNHSGPPSNAASASSPSIDGPSGSGFSTNNAQSSATSVDQAYVDNTHGQREQASSKKAWIVDPQRPESLVREPVQRYWNEFDDGSDYERDNVYTIYVDPNEPSSLPGYGTISRAAASVGNASKVSGKKLQSWFTSKKLDDVSREPLLSGQREPTSPSVEDSSDSDQQVEINRSVLTPRKKRSKKKVRWNTRRKSREVGLFRTYVGCFFTSFILLLISFILRSTGRHKARSEVDLGVVLGVVAALSFGIIGLSMMLLRKEKLTWLHRIAVSFVFCCVCIASGILLGLIGKTV